VCTRAAMMCLRARARKHIIAARVHTHTHA
jgi:hypothetical protein